MRQFVGEIADDAAVDFGPEVGIAADGPVVKDCVVALVAAVEERAGAGPDDLERGLEAVHQSIRPRPAVVDAADGAVLEIHHGIECVFVPVPELLDLLRVDPADPLANLEGGARYLREQLDRFDGDVEKALAAYNAGPGRVQQAGGVPRIRETQNYVASVMGRLSDQSRSR